MKDNVRLYGEAPYKVAVERVEFNKVLKRLNSDKEAEKDIILNRLGLLVNKSDNYCVFDIDTDKDQYRSTILGDGKGFSKNEESQNYRENRNKVDIS